MCTVLSVGENHAFVSEIHLLVFAEMFFFLSFVVFTCMDGVTGCNGSVRWLFTRNVVSLVGYNGLYYARCRSI